MNLKQVVVNGQKLNVSVGSGGSSQSESLPIGSVIMWAGTLETIPIGWHLCDGKDGTFDLRGMFVLGAGGTYNLGDWGGSEEVTLTVEQIPSHNHPVLKYYSGFSSQKGYLGNMTEGEDANATNSNVSTGYTGRSKPHPNMPPYKALYYIQKIA